VSEGEKEWRETGWPEALSGLASGERLTLWLEFVMGMDPRET